MATPTNGKIIPFSGHSSHRASRPAPRLREDGDDRVAAHPTAPQDDPLHDLSLRRRRGLETVDLAPPASIAPRIAQRSDPPYGRAGTEATASGNNAELTPAVLSNRFIASLDDMIRGTPSAAAVTPCWPRQRSTQLEKAAIDIVDMLFGFVLDDPQVPRSIKESLMQAQMPMLQMAMREPAFFSDWQHPARRLLHDIAPMLRAVGTHHEGTVGFELAFATGLARVLDNLAPNGAAFADFHRQIDALAREAPAPASGDLTEALAWERAEAVARSFLERPLPHLARDFIAGYWIDVLQRTALSAPEDSLRWQDTVAVIEDLAWSLAPKHGEEDRLQLIALIPALLTRLNRGLDLIDVDRDDRRPFFDALIDVHAKVLRQEMAPPHVPTPSGPPTQEANALAQVGRLQRGDWVEFRLADGDVSRERLTWISPQRGILVFSNHQGQRAIQIAPADLADLVREHKAQLIFDQPDATTGKNSA